MATQVANPLPASGMHTAGIYSDMTVDGPEIGTLVVVFDRAKNLPNRKTMGKQDPYCAARLGKEAKKTDTDRRGGQTPRWDQELRFTVHESPDYYNLKVSIFNDDKKTDLIGETWINLEQVIVPGGGQNDTWHNLNYRGKYAGEIRMEMSYYDSRPPVERPERQRTSMSGGFDGRSSVGGSRNTPVKRRPLPSGPRNSTPSPATTPARQSFGPRELGSRSRGASITPEHMPQNASPLYHGHPQTSEYQQYDDYAIHEADGGYESQPQEEFPMPDFLPQLPPKNRNRSSLPQVPRGLPAPHAASFEGRPHSHIILPHSHSAPNVPTAEDFDYEDDQYHPGMVPSGQSTLWNGSPYSNDPSHRRSIQGPPQVEPRALPPPPPSHSSNAVPQQHRVRGSASQTFVPSTSPLQSIERGYGTSPTSHAHSVRSQSNDENLGSSPLNARPPFRNPQLTNRHSVSDPYAVSNSPRPHPLAQEMRRSASPQPYYGNEGHPEYDEPREYYSREGSPIHKPRAVSPQPSRQPLSAIRHPIASFGAQGQAPSPGGRLATQSVVRKSVSPRASLQGPNQSSMPFSPDSFDAFNPSAGGSPLTANPNPHSPFHVPTPPRSAQAAPAKTNPNQVRNQNEPIVGWDGRQIDPSDHLPVDSWAPEPEQKSPTKAYGSGAGSDRPRGGLAGPRTSQVTPTNGGGPRMRGNVVVNVRTKARGGSETDAGYPDSGPSPVAAGRNRLVKKGGPPRSPIMGFSEGASGALKEIEVPNPYAQQGTYSPRFGGEAGFGGGYGRHTGGGYDAPEPAYQPEEYYADDVGYGGHGNGNEYGSLPPPKPPKIPIGGGGGQEDGYAGYGTSALSREMARIDIGGSSRRGPGSVAGGPPPASPARRARWGP